MNPAPRPTAGKVFHPYKLLELQDDTAFHKRQGYLQVIKDIKRVLDLKIQTISLGSLLVLMWNGANVNFMKDEFYVDFDDMSIRNITEFRIARRVNIGEGKLGILEPEK